ncbi:hypothetical protein HYH02_014371 [Chlamydomonas schloesseri]|uniref:Uncharacterized protein n=1 Tax=Chlamydomonas schloesseri TaxID=2026947 RepID=A0A835SNW2_9CHLO|nr:hypothetical protein HYH02_014371 [Chlamydomonas schloesseri]|eukprot:KAG2428567.1 hypothetical protein HYH02_014371 [Chlamydomonas schloesseri]
MMSASHNASPSASAAQPRPAAAAAPAVAPAAAAGAGAAGAAADAACARRGRLLPLALLALVLGLLSLLAVVGGCHHDMRLQQQQQPEALQAVAPPGTDEGVTGAGVSAAAAAAVGRASAITAPPATATIRCFLHLLPRDSDQGHSRGDPSGGGGGGGGGGGLLLLGRRGGGGGSGGSGSGGGGRSQAAAATGHQGQWRRQLRQRGIPGAYGPDWDDPATGYHTAPACDAQCQAICTSSPALAVAYGYRCFTTYSSSSSSSSSSSKGASGSSSGGDKSSVGGGSSASSFNPAGTGKAAPHNG